jgi:adenylate cyclase
LSVERRLAAIMFTDIVGYTALAQNDEAAALAALEGNRKLLRPAFSKFNGREVKTMGDAFLVEFPSALDAVRCAIEIQTRMHDINGGLPESRRLELRVGVHVGDIVHSQGDILGDAVNVSSRIEPLAERGGVCISGQVYDHVRNKIDRPLEKLEGRTLKNVSTPVDVYRIIMPWEEGVAVKGELDRLRVAVLPLQNMSPDPADEYFADGLTEELIATLAGVKELTVIARTSVMQYKKAPKNVVEIGRELSAGSLLEGSVRKAGNKVRITVQLIDARNDGHIWAQNYDKQLDDVFAIQTEIAEKVAEALRVELVQSERERLEKRKAPATGPYTLYLKGRHYWNERTEEGMGKAIGYFNAAVGEDPTFARGYVGLADCYGVMSRNGIMEPEEGMRRARQYALKAIELDGTLAEPWATLASTTLYVERDPGVAEEQFKKSIALNPSYPSAHQWYAHLLVTLGRLDEGMREITKARELDPLSLVIRVNYGDGLYYSGRFDEAIENFRKIVEESPNFPVVYPSLCQAYLRKSMYQEALDAAEKYIAFIGDGDESRLLKSYVYSYMGRTDEARRLLAEFERREPGEGVSPYNIGLSYFAMGDQDSGFRWLEKAYERFDGNTYQLLKDYELDGVRSDPRYLSLLERLGLKKA